MRRGGGQSHVFKTTLFFCLWLIFDKIWVPPYDKRLNLGTPEIFPPTNVFLDGSSFM